MNKFKSFAEYITEATKEVTFAWGRFNPPTVGNEKLFDATAKVAVGGAYYIYASQSSDQDKNPLDYSTKIKYMRKMFPRHARAIVLDTQINSLPDLLAKLYNEGYNKVNIVAGSDRVPEYRAMTSKYNGVKGRHGFYNFENGVNVISSSEPDLDANDAIGMSSTKLRAAAAENDFQLFSRGMPVGFKEVKQLFNDVRKGMGLNESHDFRSHLQLRSVSKAREAYVAGDLFTVGDIVNIKKYDEQAKVVMLGSNYILVETINGRKMRVWIDAVEKITEDAGSVRHHLIQPNFKHAQKHALIHKDIDFDGDVDAIDKLRPDEVVGAEPFDKGVTTKKLQKSMDKETKMAKKRIAFEGNKYSFSSFAKMKETTK